MASTGMNATMIEAKNSIQKLPNPVVMYRHNALLNGLHVLCGGEDGAHEVVVPNEHEDEDGDGCHPGRTERQRSTAHRSWSFVIDSSTKPDHRQAPSTDEVGAPHPGEAPAGAATWKLPVSPRSSSNSVVGSYGDTRQAVEGSAWDSVGCRRIWKRSLQRPTGPGGIPGPVEPDERQRLGLETLEAVSTEKKHAC
jgi:hypothetical protein